MGILDMRAATLKLEEMGRWYVGTVIAEPEETQRTEYVKGGGGAPLYWVDKRPVPGVSHDPRTGAPNEPVMQTEITVDVGEPDDYGSTERVLYIDNKRKITALRAAWRAAQMPRGSSMIGCQIAARWSGTEMGDGAQEAKLYEYRIKPPAGGPQMRAPAPAPAAPVAPAFPGNDTPAAAPAMVAAAPVSAAPATTVAVGLACPPGIDPGQWAIMAPAQRQQMYEALGLTAAQPAGPPPATGSLFTDEPPF
jgi:hypothetical protein